MFVYIILRSQDANNTQEAMTVSKKKRAAKQLNQYLSFFIFFLQELDSFNITVKNTLDFSNKKEDYKVSICLSKPC